MDELLAIVGGSWQPLLLYPGLLAGVLVAAFMRAIWRIRDNPPVPFLRRRGLHLGDAVAAAVMLFVLASLPFPRTYWAYPLDLLTVLLLLEVPRWSQLARYCQGPNAEQRRAAADEVAALLNVYVLLALAVAALGQSAGSLLLPSLKSGTPLLRWTGLATLAVALPPLASLGPWHKPELDGPLLTLRRVAHIALLLALALPAGDDWGHAATVLGAAAAFGATTVLHLVCGGAPGRWERLQPLLALAVLLLLLTTNSTTLLTRLR